MEHYRKSAHCTYDIKYHIVWITKYRKPVITKDIKAIFNSKDSFSFFNIV